MSLTTLNEDSVSNGVRNGNVPRSRRGMVAEGVEGLARFKKSKLSVILLKGGLAMAQVVTLVTLLVLSSLIPSPLDPDSPPQSTSSDQCTRPWLYQSWMGFSAFRLVLCWAVSCWMLVREERARRHNEREERTFAQDSPPETALNTPLAESSPQGGSDQSHNRFHSSASLGPDLQKEGAAESEEIKLGYDDPSDPSLRRSLVQTNSAEDEIPRTQSLAVTLDTLAPRISKSLGVISAILFLLGNILLFYPSPTSSSSCYSSAPLLWWGVMTVVGVGWFLILQLAIVAFGIGIGGPVVLTLLRKMGIVPSPEPPRPPPSQPLTKQELQSIKLVTYIPASPGSSSVSIDQESGLSDEIETSRGYDNGARRSKVTPSSCIPAWKDISRLPYPPLRLSIHHTTCAICQDVFVLPKECRRVLLDVMPLRLLGCGHVYHMSCVDRWLTTGSGNCPTCNKSVRDFF